LTKPDPSDAVLALRCQLGDQHAWELLVCRWHPRLASFVNRMLPDRSATDDVLQTVWLRVVRSMAGLREPERLAAWLFGIARRTVADRYRTAYRRPPAELIGEVTDIDDGIAQFETIDLIEQSLHQLHAIDREAVVLHYLEELPIGEVAEICSVPPGTIKSRLHRARRLLRKTLTD
jgi:RNA polymerase sigma-70 factor (ECF subfamily)